MADDAKKKARQKAFYHKQRLDAEAKVKAGGLSAGKDADTLQSIGSKLAKSKDKGAQDTAKKDLGLSARYRAGVRQGPLDPNPSAAADLAGTAASFLPAGKYAGKGIKALERWGEGAARSGMKNSGKAEKAAADVSKAASKSSGSSTTTAKVGKEAATKTRTASQQAQKAADEKAGNKIVNGGPKGSVATDKKIVQSAKEVRQKLGHNAGSTPENAGKKVVGNKPAGASDVTSKRPGESTAAGPKKVAEVKKAPKTEAPASGGSALMPTSLLRVRKPVVRHGRLCRRTSRRPINQLAAPARLAEPNLRAVKSPRLRDRLRRQRPPSLLRAALRLLRTRMTCRTPS